MPQVQFLNQQNIGGALGQFGSGFLEEITDKYKQGQEDDALEKMLNEIDPNAPEGDQLKQMLKARGIPLAKKLSVGDLFTKARGLASTEKQRLEAIERSNRDFELRKKKYDLDIASADEVKREKYYKDANPFESGLSTLDRMEGIVKNAGYFSGVGYGSSLDPQSSTREDVGAWRISSTSLISSLTSMSIKNQREFEALTTQLIDPNTRNETKMGIIKALRSRFRDQLEGVNRKYSKVGDKAQSSEDSKPSLEKILG